MNEVFKQMIEVPAEEIEKAKEYLRHLADKEIEKHNLKRVSGYEFDESVNPETGLIRVFLEVEAN